MTARVNSNDSGGNQGKSMVSRSYVAMILSALLPGLGQLYLAQFVKGVIIFFIFASALLLFYVNSLPVTEWSDLLRFSSVVQEQPYEIHIWTFDDGEKLMYRPSWKFKITASIQAVLCWLYAVSDGWRGRRRTGAS